MSRFNTHRFPDKVGNHYTEKLDSKGNVITEDITLSDGEVITKPVLIGDYMKYECGFSPSVTEQKYVSAKQKHDQLRRAGLLLQSFNEATFDAQLDKDKIVLFNRKEDHYEAVSLEPPEESSEATEDDSKPENDVDPSTDPKVNGDAENSSE